MGRLSRTSSPLVRGRTRRSAADPTADGAREVGDGEYVPHEPGRPDEDGKAERRRQEVADPCVPNHAGVARRDDTAWGCVSELACGNVGSGGSWVKVGRASALGRHYHLKPNRCCLRAKLSQDGLKRGTY